MVGFRYRKVRLYKFKDITCVWIIKYILLVHIASAQYTGTATTTTATPTTTGIPVGHSCAAGGKCASNLTCFTTNYTCGCQGDYYYSNSTNSCSLRKAHGQGCSDRSECVSILNCVNLKCDCDDGFYYNTSSPSCSSRKAHGQGCSDRSECISILNCVNSKCDCDEGFYYNTSSPSCSSRKAHGQGCSDRSECISILNCVNSKCDCDEGFYYNTSSPSCSSKLGHGVPCQSAGPTNQCKISHTACLPPYQAQDTRCLCDSGFYWDNSSSCIPTANLSITARVVNRGTTTVTFEWSEVPGRSDVSYSITWGVSNMSANKTGATVTGLEPGTSYNFNVVTSLPGLTNYALVTANQPQATVWTYPGKPGSVTVSRVANSTYTYKVTFEKSNGSAFLYTMSVSTGGSIKETQSSTSTTMYFTNLIPATAYNYTLWSQNNISESSEPATGNFITDAEAPGPVNNTNYKGVQSHTASLTWQPPPKPNGNITGYLVEVALQTIAGCVYYIKVDQVNTSLLPSCNLMNANITTSDEGYNLELLHLKPYRNYTVTVRAVNKNGLGEPVNVTFQTNISAPNDISDLTVISVRDESTQKVNLTISWKPGEQTGPTDYYILIEALDTGGSNQSSSPDIVTEPGYSSNNYLKNDVLAYWSYNISVWAQTDQKNSSLKFAQNRTVETNPGAVQNLSVTQDSPAANNVTLTFECPDIWSRNGRIEKFVITQTLLHPQTSAEDELIKYDHNATDKPCSSQYKVIAQNIKVERNYSFSVMTVNNKYKGGISNYSRFYVQPKVPQLSNLYELFKVDTLVKPQEGSSHEQTKINIYVCSACLTDVRWGRVVNVGILVCVDKCTAPGRKKRSDSQFTNLKSWRDAKKEGFVSEYRTTPNNWIPTLNGTNSYTWFVVGENTSCSDADLGYCNGPLPGGNREYFISVIMCTTEGCTIYRESKPFRTYAPDSEPSQVGAIVGGVLGGLALIAVIGVIVILIRQLQSRKEKRKETPKNPDTRETGGNAYTPRQVATERMTSAQLRENSHIYDEVDDYDYIQDDTGRSSRHYQRPNNVRQDMRSREHFRMDTRDSLELEFPYENEIPVNY